MSAVDRQRRVAAVTGVLAFMFVILLLGSMAQDFLSLGGRTHLLDLDAEDSVFTWLSQLVLAFAGLAALRLSLIEGASLRPQWAMVAALLLLMSADEAISLHDAIWNPIPWSVKRAFLGRYWIPLLGLACLGALLAAFPFLRRLPRRTAALLILAAVLYVAGGVGFQYLEMLIYSHNGHDVTAAAYRWIVTAEEAFEGAGSLLALFVLSSAEEEPA